MPAEWTTPEQKAFLLEELVAFKWIGGKHYTKHWQTLFQKWSQRWPERLSTLPGIPDDSALTDGQKETLATAVLKRQKQLRAWMHWHAGAGQNRSANSKTATIVNDLLKPKTRTKKLWEIYSNLYYSTRIQPAIEVGTPIADVNKKIREMYENESPEIQEEVVRISEQQKKDSKKKKSQRKDESDESDDDREDVKMDPSVLRR